MDIPAVSVAMHQASLAQNVNIALTKKMRRLPGTRTEKDITAILQAATEKRSPAKNLVIHRWYMI